MTYNKYKNKKVIYDGIKFASIKEKNRYIILKDKESRGIIKDLKLQSLFILVEKQIYKGKTIRKLTYRSDFEYWENKKRIVEDVKGFKTEVYKIKKKIFLSIYGKHIDFREL